MKQLIIIFLLLCPGFTALGQANKQPVYVDDAPSVFNYTYDAYYNYADQGQAMYQNNPHFYQKDNFSRDFPDPGNGFYTRPGNSNPVNQQLYDGPPAPATTIYSGYIPVREAGGTPAYGRDGNYR